jgi:hypothetical protein
MTAGGTSRLSYCPFCGRKRVGEGRFCAACGREFSSSVPVRVIDRRVFRGLEPKKPEPSRPEPMPAPTPHVEPAAAAAPETPLSQEASAPTSASPRRPFSPSMLNRILTALLLFVTAASTLAYFIGFVGLDSKVRVPYTYPGLPGSSGGIFDLKGHGEKTVWRTYQAPQNGISVAGFLAMAFSSLLLLNRLFRRQGGRGPVDRLLGALARRRSKAGVIVPFLLPAALLAFSIACLSSYVFTPVHFHLDPREAARELSAAGIRGWDLSQTGAFLFGKNVDGQVQVALLTPALVRELDRKGMKIGGREGPREYPIPGVLPLAMMAALSGWVFIGRFTLSPRKERGGPVKHAVRTFLAFGILNGYVVAWLVSAQAGVLDRDGAFDVSWLFHFGPFALAAAAVLAVIHRKIQSPDLTLESRQGWMSLFLLVGAAMPLGSYFLSNASKGSPAAFWVFLYAGLSALYALLARLSPAGKRGVTP